jgi:hypothetical protein
VNTNLLSRVLAVIGVVTLSATAAHAGHGQGGGGQTVPGYACYSAPSVNERAVVDVAGTAATVSTAFADQTDLNIAQGKTICVAVMVSLITRPNLVPPAGQPPTFNALPISDALVLKCYNMTQVTTNNPDVVVKVTDGLDIVTLALQSIQSLCLKGVLTPVNP